MISPQLALFGGMLLACLAFAKYRGAIALTWSFVLGYLLLPAAGAINFQGLPPVDKERAIWLGAVVGTLLFQPGALARVRWHPADAVLSAVVLLSGYSSIVNGLGYWDAASSAGGVILSWVLPYALARVHFRQASDLVNLGKVLFWGAVLYVPLTVWEFRMSPQFHNVLYGYFPYSAWLQSVRWGYYRPVVFLGHGLNVGSFFSACFLIGLILLRNRLSPRPLSAPAWLVIAWVGLGLAVCLSVGPWVGVALGWAAFRTAKRWPRAAVAAGVPGVLWVAVILTTGSNWSWMVRPFEALGATGRAASLQYRLDAMAEHARNIRQRPWFGYGGWGRGRSERWATDSHALVYMLKGGVVGAAAWYTWMFLMVFAACRAARRTRSTAESELILLYACVMGIGITASALGVATSHIHVALIGGAVTGLAAAERGVRTLALRQLGPHVGFAGHRWIY